jgi:hypothetical protein
VVGILSFLSLLGRTKKVACQYKETQYRPKVGRLGNGGFATAVIMVTKEPKRLKASASASAADSANLANLFANSSQFQAICTTRISKRRRRQQQLWSGPQCA